MPQGTRHIQGNGREEASTAKSVIEYSVQHSKLQWSVRWYLVLLTWIQSCMYAKWYGHSSIGGGGLLLTIIKNLILIPVNIWAVNLDDDQEQGYLAIHYLKHPWMPRTADLERTRVSFFWYRGDLDHWSVVENRKPYQLAIYMRIDSQFLWD